MTTERPIYPLVIPAVAHVFELLRIHAALYYRVPWRVNPWWPLHNEAVHLSSFEVEHGVEDERFAYNDRMFAEVERTKKQLRTAPRLLGLFVPVVAARKGDRHVGHRAFSCEASSRPISFSSAGNRSAVARDTSPIRSLRRTYGSPSDDGARQGPALCLRTVLERAARLMAGQAPADELCR